MGQIELFLFCFYSIYLYKKKTPKKLLHQKFQNEYAKNAIP